MNAILVSGIVLLAAVAANAAAADDTVTALTFGSDETYLIVGRADGSVALWDLTKKAVVGNSPPAPSTVRALFSIPQSRRYFEMGDELRVTKGGPQWMARIWLLEQGPDGQLLRQPVASTKVDSPSSWTGDLDPSGQRLALGGDLLSVSLFDLSRLPDSGQLPDEGVLPHSVLTGPKYALTDVRFCGPGGRLAATTIDYKLFLFDTSPQAEEQLIYVRKAASRIGGSFAPPLVLACNTELALVAGVLEERSYGWLGLWAITEGERVDAVNEDEAHRLSPLREVEVDATGRYVVTRSEAGYVVWRIEDRKLRMIGRVSVRKEGLVLANGFFRRAAFSSSGDRLALADGRNVLVVRPNDLAPITVLSEPGYEPSIRLENPVR